MTRQIIEWNSDHAWAVRYDPADIENINAGAVRLFMTTQSWHDLLEFSRGYLMGTSPDLIQFRTTKPYSAIREGRKATFNNAKLRDMGLAGSMLAQQMLDDIYAAKEKMATKPRVLSAKEGERWNSPDDWRIMQVLR